MLEINGSLSPTRYSSGWRAAAEPDIRAQCGTGWHENRERPETSNITGHSEIERYWYLQRKKACYEFACARSEHEEPDQDCYEDEQG